MNDRNLSLNTQFSKSIDIYALIFVATIQRPFCSTHFLEKGGQVRQETVDEAPLTITLLKILIK